MDGEDAESQFFLKAPRQVISVQIDAGGDSMKQTHCNARETANGNADASSRSSDSVNTNGTESCEICVAMDTNVIGNESSVTGNFEHRSNDCSIGQSRSDLAMTDTDSGTTSNSAVGHLTNAVIVTDMDSNTTNNYPLSNLTNTDDNKANNPTLTLAMCDVESNTPNNSSVCHLTNTDGNDFTLCVLTNTLKVTDTTTNSTVVGHLTKESTIGHITNCPATDIKSHSNKADIPGDAVGYHGDESGADEALLRPSTNQQPAGGEIGFRPSPGSGRYSRALHTLLPLRCSNSKEDTVPVGLVGCLSYMTFGWMTSIMWDVYHHGVGSRVSRMRLPPVERAEVTGQRMERFWKEELQHKGTEKASFGQAIVLSFKTRLVVGGVVSLVSALLTLANPVFVIRYFLEYLSVSEVSLRSGFHYALLLGLIILLRGLVDGAFWMLNYEAASRIKFGTLALLYKKILNLKNLKDKTVGDIVNFVSNDGQRIWDGIIMGPFLIRGPIILIISLVYGLLVLGPWALIGWFIVILFYPFSAICAKLSQNYRQRGITITDKRVGLTTELLNCIKLVKMSAWEVCFQQKISGLRAEEHRVLERSVFVQSISVGSSTLVPIFSSCLTFIAYVSTGNNLSAAQAFTYVSLLNSMQSLSVVPFAMKAISEMVVTVQRIKDLLLMEELSALSSSVSCQSNAVEVNNLSCSWNKRLYTNVKDTVDETTEVLADLYKQQDDLSRPIYSRSTLKDVTFTLKKGQLIGVCGQVGSGKSSLINALLGRMNIDTGTISVSCKSTYVAQQPWIMADTVRANILFNSQFDETRYQKVLKACALTSDLKELPFGDLTKVGEKGATLSGGQKQRVSLARAMYSHKDLLLLDDVLSSVDVHTGDHILQQCIKGLLQGCTIVFATNNLQHLEKCDQILVMRDGTLVEYGTHSKLLKNGAEYSRLAGIDSQNGGGDIVQVGQEFSDSFIGEQNHKFKKIISSTDFSNAKFIKNGFTNCKEDSSEKRTKEILLLDAKTDEEPLQLAVVRQYIAALKGCRVLLPLCLVFALPVTGVTCAGWYLSYWLDQGAKCINITSQDMAKLQINSNREVSMTAQSAQVLDAVSSLGVANHPDRNHFMLIYALFIPGLIVAMLLRSFSMVKATLSASSHLHQKSLSKVLYSKMSFFYSTPIGSLINRFSADLDTIDVSLPMMLELFLNNVLQVIAAVVVISLISPWFLVAVIPLGLLFFCLMGVFHTCVHQLKSMDNATRTPVLSHLNTSVQGISTIHAFGQTGNFVQQYCDVLNANSAAVFLFYCANRWLAIRLDLVCAAVATATGLLVLLTFDQINPALAGLAIYYAIQMTGLFQYTARLAIETEARFSSVRRILDLSHIPQEEDMSEEEIEEKNFIPGVLPSNGEIEFTCVRMRYQTAFPLALDNVSFKIKSRQKFGIVGRTGAGKTSLSAVLFRLVDAESGSVHIDGMDISQFEIRELRSKLAIIPQDPNLFSGSIRFNLDPFGRHSDSDIWHSLGQCHCAEMVKGLDHKLDHEVQMNGDNFSLGEKQLLCLTRALIQNCQIVIFDEATAAVDVQTDALIQSTLHDVFHHCSMMIIAHRPHTVLHCDQIVFMENGKVIECDTPQSLLSNRSSRFRAMLQVVNPSFEAKFNLKTS